MSNLRPMQLGEILDGTFSIYRRHFALFMQLSMIIMWLPTALWVYLQVHFGGENALETMALFQERPFKVILIGLGLVLLLTAAGLMLKAGTIRIISDSYLGQDPKLGPALQLGVEKIIPLVLVAIGKGLLLFLIYLVGAAAVVAVTAAARLAGTAAAVLAAVAGAVGVVWFLIFVMCGYGVTTPAVVLEDLSSSFDAFGRSWDLSRAFRLKVFGVAAVAWLIAVLLPMLVVGTLSAVLGRAAPVLQPFLVVLSSFLGILLGPIMPCALTLLYYDLRVRREAFDLQILSQQLGIS